MSPRAADDVRGRSTTQRPSSPSSARAVIDATCYAVVDRAPYVQGSRSPFIQPGILMFVTFNFMGLYT